VVNKSVEAFRKLTLDMQRQILTDAVAELNAQADQLVTTMKSVVKHGPTGDLGNSIRKQPGSKVTIVRVMAGGATTTHPGRHGKPAFDYARAVEFGTVHNPAEPFFFPTFRLMRKPMRSAMRRKITARVKQYSAE
jgi:HK97 gp10 family phage protein